MRPLGWHPSLVARAARRRIGAEHLSARCRRLALHLPAQYGNAWVPGAAAAAAAKVSRPLACKLEQSRVLLQRARDGVVPTGAFHCAMPACCLGDRTFGAQHQYQWRAHRVLLAAVAVSRNVGLWSLTRSGCWWGRSVAEGVLSPRPRQLVSGPSGVALPISSASVVSTSDRDWASLCRSLRRKSATVAAGVPASAGGARSNPTTARSDDAFSMPSQGVLPCRAARSPQLAEVAPRHSACDYGCKAEPRSACATLEATISINRVRATKCTGLAACALVKERSARSWPIYCAVDAGAASRLATARQPRQHRCSAERVCEQ